MRKILVTVVFEKYDLKTILITFKPWKLHKCGDVDLNKKEVLKSYCIVNRPFINSLFEIRRESLNTP